MPTTFRCGLHCAYSMRQMYPVPEDIDHTHSRCPTRHKLPCADAVNAVFSDKAQCLPHRTGSAHECHSKKCRQLCPAFRIFFACPATSQPNNICRLWLEHTAVPWVGAGYAWARGGMVGRACKDANWEDDHAGDRDEHQQPPQLLRPEALPQGGPVHLLRPWRLRAPREQSAGVGAVTAPTTKSDSERLHRA